LDCVYPLQDFTANFYTLKLNQKIYQNPTQNLKITILNQNQNQEPRQADYWNKLENIITKQANINDENGQNILQKVFEDQIPDIQKTYLSEIEIKNIPDLKWDTDSLRVFVTLDGTNIDGNPIVNFVGRKGFEYFLVEGNVKIAPGILEAIKDECGVAGSDYSQFSANCYTDSINGSTQIQKNIKETTNNIIAKAEII
jgi:hypothetical protein